MEFILIHHAQTDVSDVSARSFIGKTQCCCMQGLRFPHTQSANRQLRKTLTQLVFWGAMCCNGLECAGGGNLVSLLVMQRRGCQKSTLRPTKKRLHRHMNPWRSKSQTQPQRLGTLPALTLQIHSKSTSAHIWLSSAQPPNREDYRN